MTPQEEETLWRNRFILINLVRIGGTIVVLLALALWQSDLFVRGGRQRRHEFGAQRSAELLEKMTKQIEKYAPAGTDLKSWRY